VVCVALSSSPAWAQDDLQLIQDDMQTVEVRLRNLGENYLTPAMIHGVRGFRERLADGEVAFRLGDYTQSSFVFYEVANEAAYAKEPGLPKAIYYLAESLYQIKNAELSRHYFERLISFGSTPFLEDAVKRLMEISNGLRSWKGLDRYVKVLETHGGLSSEVAYYYAKSLLLQRRPKTAIKVLDQFDQAHPLMPKARYLLGVGLVQKGEFDEAAKVFESLTKLSDEHANVRQLRELSAMNRGRIWFEQAKITEAIDAYQHIDRHSPYFDQALFEVTWAYVRAAETTKDYEEREKSYIRALNALEILLLGMGESRIAPEARLLIGSVLSELGRYTEATETFEKVVERYTPVRDELKGLTEQIQDPLAYFKKVSEARTQGEGLLPPQAERWEEETPQLQQAFGIVDELHRGRRWLHESRTIIEKLMAAVDGGKSTTFFPRMQEARERQVEIERSVLSISERILAVQQRAAQGVLTAQENQELTQLQQRRKQLAPTFRQVHADVAAVDRRVKARKRSAQSVLSRNFQIRWEIDAMRRQVAQMRLWVRLHGRRLDDTKRSQADATLGQEDVTLRALTDTQESLDKELESILRIAAQQSRTEARARKVRAEYFDTLSKARNILATAGARLSGPGANVFAQADQWAQKLALQHVETVRIRDQLDKAIDNNSKEIYSSVLGEYQQVTKQESVLENTQREAEQAVGELAKATLDGVKVRFDDVIIRGDVGVIDVVWKKKETQRAEIERRVQVQQREIGLLEREFQEVLQEF
jgi:tetratricopeptide (TPR) repeat protein